MKPGDLAQYVPSAIEAFDSPFIHYGLVLRVDDQHGLSHTCNIRVRWFDHTDSQRDWYAQQELTVISKCTDLK